MYVFVLSHHMSSETISEKKYFNNQLLTFVRMNKGIDHEHIPH